jgi:hypothetical protein
LRWHVQFEFIDTAPASERRGNHCLGHLNWAKYT